MKKFAGGWTWTQEEDDKLRELWKREPCAAVAKAVSAVAGITRTRKSIIGRALRLKLERHFYVLHPGPRPRPSRVAERPSEWARPPEGSGRLRAIAKARQSRIRFRGVRPSKQLRSEQGVPDKLVMAPRSTRKPVSILKRTERQCSYIVGEPRGPSTMMCGAPVDRRSLCAIHLKGCWQLKPKAPTNPAGRRQQSALVPFIGEIPFG